MIIAKWMQQHHRSILFILISLAIAGVVSGFFMPVSLFPQITFPRVVLSLDSGDRPAEQMAIEVTKKVEESVRSVPGLKSIRSTTSRGSADISINFKWGTDMVAAMLQVESATARILSNLPKGTTFEVRRMDPTVFPILGYSLQSKIKSQVELKDIALYQIRPILSNIDGVANIGILGGDDEEFQVVVKPEKLAEHNLSLNDILIKLNSSSVLQAIGKIEENYKLYLVMSDTQPNSLKKLQKIVLKTTDFGSIILEDVAKIQIGTAPKWNRTTADGSDALLFQVYQQPDGNTVQIAKDVKNKLSEIKSKLPKSIKFGNWYDQSTLIIASAKSVRDALLIGVFLAVLVLLIFLKNFRITIIAAITVPIVLAVTVLLLKIFGMSFNIMTLGGMAAAVALIIDDSIVMIEHIIRTLQGGEGHYKERIQKAVVEFTKPLAGSSSSTIIIFAPLAFLSGVTGAFFKALSLTMATSLIISFLIAWVGTPIMAIHLMRQKDAVEPEPGKITKLFTINYKKLMTKFFHKPLTIVFILIPLLFVGYISYKNIGSGFMPSMDEGGFILDYRASSGTSLTETDRLLKQIEVILQETPEVNTYSRRTGLSLGGFITEANEGDYFIRLKPLPRKPLDEVMDDIRMKINKSVPGIEIEMAKLMEDLIGDLTAVPQPIEIKLFSDNNDLLKNLSEKIANKIKKIKGVVDVRSGIVPAGDELDINVDLAKASLEGLNPSEISDVLNNYSTGAIAASFQKGPKMINVRVWVPDKYRNSINNLKMIKLRGNKGQLVPLKRVATFSKLSGKPQINRDNLKRMVAVTGRISGRDMGSTIHEILKYLNAKDTLPNSVFYHLGGMYEQQQIAFKGLLAVFLSAIALVFALLLYLYESFRVSIAMILTTIIAAATVFTGLWLTKMDLNITAMMGMTMVIGIVTEVSIFYYSEFKTFDENIDFETRLINAGINRARPIAMTTLAAILALFPLAMGLGEGASMLQPLAIAIESGLFVQFFIVLIGLPVMLFIFSNKNKNIANL